MRKAWLQQHTATASREVASTHSRSKTVGEGLGSELQSSAVSTRSVQRQLTIGRNINQFATHLLQHTAASKDAEAIRQAGAGHLYLQVFQHMPTSRNAKGKKQIRTATRRAVKLKASTNGIESFESDVGASTGTVLQHITEHVRGHLTETGFCFITFLSFVRAY